ncbi:MAG: sugar phosphate nucleotidyltransferase [Candidatus Omnitrophica bacterium]|nr:sugar phosphate nucleotidyltransferase [Candidatus Omnitrophota bacterium]MDD5236195.1 sugar phosphate nucleotidyltransferase [Candidatus Omnitrophota bacterium]MDD5610174.1 sugar phosphate nucleotidyltransferase [Candidatus Omnitrophota bacterium]
MKSDIPVVILCGGKGTRMGNDELPKPMFRIGDKPMLSHIMSIYSHYGFNNFILALGYKKEKFREYFKGMHKWKIKFVDTGLETNTGGRIKKLESLIKSEIFLATYGDGLSDVDINKVLDYHLCRGKIATLVSVRPHSPFGIIGIDTHTDRVTHFEEKPMLDHWINGGFFVFNRSVFKYMGKNDILERDVLPSLAKDKNLLAYKHDGFWKCMDTYKDNLNLNELWKKGNAPWAAWLCNAGIKKECCGRTKE